ncbi:Iron-sulfur assembly protein IscA-like 2, mitochondrial [Sesamum angolense]|uniref:Iron-sulfur assembly protein IscA-like 2, mitochondrial n=1 Tax=Sesamum angolense TaxID=2727404 RepID=A0AAE1WNC3_9LAMI|nr:Iron-sulfur assembly protein IscA-like 2, mitochondrial [Sesamum angolense]
MQEHEQRELDSNRIFEQDGVKLVVDNVSFDFVKGATVDYVEELIRSAFQTVFHGSTNHIPFESLTGSEIDTVKYEVALYEHGPDKVSHYLYATGILADLLVNGFASRIECPSLFHQRSSGGHNTAVHQRSIKSSTINPVLEESFLTPHIRYPNPTRHLYPMSLQPLLPTTAATLNSRRYSNCSAGVLLLLLRAFLFGSTWLIPSGLDSEDFSG